MALGPFTITLYGQLHPQGFQWCRAQEELRPNENNLNVNRAEGCPCMAGAAFGGSFVSESVQPAATGIYATCRLSDPMGHIPDEHVKRQIPVLCCLPGLQQGTGTTHALTISTKLGRTSPDNKTHCNLCSNQLQPDFPGAFCGPGPSRISCWNVSS